MPGLHKLMVFLGVGLCALPTALWSAARTVPSRPDTHSLSVTFNGETITASYVLIDARTTAEKEADTAHGRLKGSVIVFFQGHAQRPADAYKFTAALASQSRAGIVIIPVCDTPYGTDATWRGDQGKDVVLMQIVRAVLGNHGISIDGYHPLTNKPVEIHGLEDPSTTEGSVVARLSAVGWSHGAILARRFAYAYAASITGLGHVCPAGYQHWTSSAQLAGRFAWEGMRIGTLVFQGHAGDALGCGWGLTKGLVGDFSRSVPSAVCDLQPSKLGRSCRDIQDCMLYCDDTNFPLPGIQHIVVIFGRDDTCMDPQDYGLSKAETLAPEETAVFWKTYYPASSASGAHLTLKVLPGTHIGPVSHTTLFAPAILRGLDELDEEEASPTKPQP